MYILMIIKRAMKLSDAWSVSIHRDWYVILNDWENYLKMISVKSSRDFSYSASSVLLFKTLICSAIMNYKIGNVISTIISLVATVLNLFSLKLRIVDRRSRRSHLVDKAQIWRLSYRTYQNLIMWMRRPWQINDCQFPHLDVFCLTRLVIHLIVVLNFL